VLLCTLFCCWFLIVASDSRYQITSLPGFNSSLITFKQYSGYVTVNKEQGRNLFYWFVESQNVPATDPVVLWFTGGPGCSSLFAFFTENGPFRVNPDGQTLFLNPYAWNKIVNMIFVESPCGVGFSYSDNGNYTTGDNQTAEDAFNFVLGFFKLFPEFVSNKFFVSGESYGGHYVPQLSYLLYQRRAQVPVTFIGFSVGNPSTDNNFDFTGYIPFVYYHALASDEAYNAAYTRCDNGRFYEARNLPGCMAAMYNIRTSMGRINPYDVYAPCYGYYDAHGGCFTQDAIWLQIKRALEENKEENNRSEKKRN